MMIYGLFVRATATEYTDSIYVKNNPSQLTVDLSIARKKPNRKIRHNKLLI
jgi:hypothetical protein